MEQGYMKINAISISDRKGVRKKNIDSSVLIEEFGLESDAHGGKWHRQVSFLAEESIQSMRDKGLDVVAGNFAENITTEGIDLPSLPVGTHLTIADTEVVISQLGKICHNRCAIYHQAGDCVMPREGIFGVVIKGGKIAVGDAIKITGKQSESLAIVGSSETEKNLSEQLEKIVRDKWNPTIVRFDVFNPKKNNLPAIIKDLVQEQKVDRIIVFDPELNHGLQIDLFGDKTETDNKYSKGASTIFYCKTIDELG